MASINLGISKDMEAAWLRAEPWERVRAADNARSAIRAALGLSAPRETNGKAPQRATEAPQRSQSRKAVNEALRATRGR